jgi:hypothetical protein
LKNALAKVFRIETSVGDVNNDVEWKQTVLALVKEVEMLEETAMPLAHTQRNHIGGMQDNTTGDTLPPFDTTGTIVPTGAATTTCSTVTTGTTHTSTQETHSSFP